MAYKEIVATIGTYEKDGQKKYLTRNVGRLIDTDKGPRIKLDASFNPAGCPREEDGSVWLAVFDPKPREQAVASTRQAPAPRNNSDMPPQNFDNFDDDIPFN